MDNRRKVMIAILIIGLPLFIWLQFFEIPNKVKLGEERMQQDPETHTFENVVQYESLSMGDASNSNNLMDDLPLNQYKKNIELDAEDLTLFVNYEIDTESLGKTAQQSVVYNTTASFALIENLEEMVIAFTDKTYTISRDRVEKWFGMTLVDFSDPEVFEEKVQQPLTDNITSWFLAYIESE